MGLLSNLSMHYKKVQITLLAGKDAGSFMLAISR